MVKSRKRKEIEDLRRRMQEIDPESSEFKNLFREYSNKVGLPAALHLRSSIQQGRKL